MLLDGGVSKEIRNEGSEGHEHGHGHGHGHGTRGVLIESGCGIVLSREVSGQWTKH
jgi:hypothetical protein